jgi:hypothetical protein
MHARSRWLIVGACSALTGAACDGLIGLEQPSIAPRDAGKAHDAATGPDASSRDAGTDAAAAADAGDAASADSPSGPSVLVSGVNLGPLATDATYVYWLDPTLGRVMRCPIAGCPSGPTVFYQQPGYNQGAGWGVGGIAAQSDSIYFAMNQTVDGMLLQCPSGGCASPSYIVKGTNGSGGIFGVTTDSSQVYFGMGAGLFACPIGAMCSAPPPALVATGVSAHMGGIAAAYGRVYFATNAAPTPVGECSATGCSGMPALLNSPTGLLAGSLASNATSVFWTVEGPGSQIFVSLWPTSASGTFATLPAPTSLAAIVADDNTVYFGSQAPGGAIYSCPATGCGSGPTLVAGDLGSVGALAIDPYRIYAGVFSTGQPSQIIEIPR